MCFSCWCPLTEKKEFNMILSWLLLYISCIYFELSWLLLILPATKCQITRRFFKRLGTNMITLWTKAEEGKLQMCTSRILWLLFFVRAYLCCCFALKISSRSYFPAQNDKACQCHSHSIRSTIFDQPASNQASVLDWKIASGEIESIWGKHLIGWFNCFSQKRRG